ncbi:hypothetical protein AMELA_G00240150 [Ameiurus melas]|uniref:Uncharacterized protein n=1 Tax=Ameiurus melas TaxID=219545 RepID=A0A7J5ZXU5_AMEME|nr:hypothetical protein AMELA_G00240150 [Ameiurus melas]
MSGAKDETGKRARERRERERGSEWERKAKAGKQREREREKRRRRSGHRCKDTPLHCNTVPWNSAPFAQVWLTVKLEQLQHVLQHGYGKRWSHVT